MKLALDNLLSRASMPEIWRALGGGDAKKAKGGWRGKAFWRDGDGLNVRITERSCRCYVTGESFTLLGLIEIALGCSRREAVAWLAAFYGVALDQQSRKEADEWARRRRRAEAPAAELTDWRKKLLLALRKERNRLYRSEAIASAAARVLIANPGPDDEQAWEVIWAAAQDDLRGDAFQAELDRLERMTPAELRGLRESETRRAA